MIFYPINIIIIKLIYILKKYNNKNIIYTILNKKNNINKIFKLSIIII